MPLINVRDRHRRMAAAELDAWKLAEHDPRDPGLRDIYESIPRAPITLIALPLVKDVNHGGLLRTAEAFRIERVDLSPEADGAVDCSGHRGARSRQPHRWVEATQAIAEARSEGKFLVAVTLSRRAVDVADFPWQFPLALVLGREIDGIPPEVEAACDATVAIPLFGIVQYLNVATAAGIVLHTAVRAYARQNSNFRPARSASRRLIG